jgi:hypothetical protein
MQRKTPSCRMIRQCLIHTSCFGDFKPATQAVYRKMYQHLRSSWPNLQPMVSSWNRVQALGLTNLDSELDSRHTPHCQEQTVRDLARRAHSVPVDAC